MNASRVWLYLIKAREEVHHRQARVENAFFRYTSIIVDGLRARSGGGREVAASLACRVLNRMTALGRPESLAISR
jgi:hypothetical protein